MARVKPFSAVCLFTLLLGSVELTSPSTAVAQPVDIEPITFHRFRVSNHNRGYLLTHNYNEGAYAGFVYDPWPSPAFTSDYVEIVPSPGPGYTLQPGQYVMPLHRWRVTESGRTYYYYSLWYSQHGSNYFYDGIAGYAFPPSYNGENGMHFHELYIYYSQRYGYWYSLHRPEYWHYQTTLGQFPDGDVYNTSYRYHGVTAKLLVKRICSTPTGVATGACPVFRFDPPPPPPPDNDGDGFNGAQDCNDSDNSIYPGAPIYCEYGWDRNCNWTDDWEECYPPEPCPGYPFCIQ